jgi:phosphoribosylformylglycinamidine synthase
LAHIASEIHAVVTAIQKGLILSVHDISEGGLAVALAEMSFENQIGVNVTVPGSLSNEKKLWSETGGFILEVAKEKCADITAIFSHDKVTLIPLGKTIAEPRLYMQNCIDVEIKEAKKAWENGLREKLE